MKNGYIIITLILILSFLLMPLLAISEKPKTDENISSGSTSSVTDKKAGEVAVYISESKTVVNMSVKDYICGVVAAEMPASYETEALKAQAVCAYTYLCKKLKENNTNDYDITDDYKVNQGYITLEKRKSKWGENFSEYENKILSAVEQTLNKKITYNGEIIFAAYHAISSGKTEAAENVWGGDYPYLISVESEGDLLAKDYLTEKTFSVADFTGIIKEKVENMPETVQEYIGESVKSKVGTVLKITICGKEFKGTEIREYFDLRSSNFDIAYDEKTGFIFTVKGYGHGVGMSQNGANYLAKQGKTYEEIIKHYYKGVEISDK